MRKALIICLLMFSCAHDKVPDDIIMDYSVVSPMMRDVATHDVMILTPDSVDGSITVMMDSIVFSSERRDLSLTLQIQAFSGGFLSSQFVCLDEDGGQVLVTVEESIKGYKVSLWEEDKGYVFVVDTVR